MSDCASTGAGGSFGKDSQPIDLRKCRTEPSWIDGVIDQLSKPAVKRSFSPRQWFAGQSPPRGLTDEEGYTEDRVLWVYRQNQLTGKWESGFYSPQGEWMHDESFDTKIAAAARVRWLNGGNESGPKREESTQASTAEQVQEAARKGFYGG